MEPGALPALDQHETSIEADREHVWAALVDVIDGMVSSSLGERYARLVRCDPTRASGPRPLGIGSTVPGFRVSVAEPYERLVLEGRHAFSEYSLTFRLDAMDPGSTRLTADSHARFPGPQGSLYRLLVIRTRFHVVAVRRMLRTIRRRAESGSSNNAQNPS